MRERQGRDEPYEIGVIGAGRVATRYHLPIISSRGDTTVAFVADTDSDRARATGRTYDCPAVVIEDDPAAIPDCDAAVLAIPAGAREPYVDAFARRGTPVLVEKPFAADLDTHRRFLETHDTLACNYMRPNYSSLRQSRGVVRSGVFGDLHRIELRESAKVGAIGLPGNHYQTDPDAPGAGILLERGSHLLSQLDALVPNDTVTVTDGAVVRTAGVDTEVSASMRAESTGVDVDVRLSAARNVGDELRLVFDSATVTVRGAASVTVAPADGVGASFSLAPDDRWATTILEAITLRWSQFIELAFEAQTVDTAAQTGLAVSRMIDDVRSASGVEQR